MKNAAVLTLDSEVSLVKLARALRAARLTRGESQTLAAERIGVGLSTLRRLESTSGISGVAAGTVFTALSIYGLHVGQIDSASPSLEKPARSGVNVRAKLLSLV